jgi:pentatricopeptide repeat protein
VISKCGFNSVLRMKVKYKSSSTGKKFPKFRLPAPKPLQKIDVKVSNDRMASAAKQKKLGDCLRIFNSISSPTKHSYANIVNACVRCGRLDLAEQYHAQMISRIGKCLITSTTLLKGYFMACRSDATRLYARICTDHSDEVGGRTLDTFLRGCLRLGLLDEAISAFQQARVRSEHSLEMYQHALFMKMDTWSAADINIPGSSISGHLVNAKAYIISRNFDAATESLDSLDTLLEEQQPVSLKFEDHQRTEFRKESAVLRRFIQQPTDTEFRDYFFANFYSSSFTAALSARLESVISPVKLEICSGLGEWILSRCIEEPETLWIASELRFDRSFDIAFSGYLRGVTNVIVCCGDVRDALTFLKESSIREIHVNFPEPPACHEGESDSSTDLMTGEFIVSVLSKLSIDGNLKIVTDNSRYAEQLRSRFAGHKVNCRTVKSIGVSYFDRMFQRGGKSSRYEIVVNI